MAMAEIVVVTILAILGGAAIYRSHLFAFQDFGLPKERAEGAEGVVTLVGIHFLSGWIFSFAGAFLNIPGTTVGGSTLRWGIMGVVLVGVFRLRLLTRNYRLAIPVPRSPESGNLGLALSFGFGIIIFLTGTGDFSKFIRDAAPTPVALPVILIGSATIATLFEEIIWSFWRRLPSYRRNLERTCRASVNGLEDEPAGLLAFEIFLRFSESYEPTSISTISTAFRGASEGRIDDAVRGLLVYGLLVPVDVSVVRRNPEYFALQRNIVVDRLARMTIETLSQQEVESLLDGIGSAYDSPLPAAIVQYLTRFEYYRQRAIEALLNEALEMMATSNDRDRQIWAEYLKLRYWQKRRGEEVADGLGYSREHAIRSIRPRALGAFTTQVKQVMVSKIPGETSRSSGLLGLSSDSNENSPLEPRH